MSFFVLISSSGHFSLGATKSDSSSSSALEYSYDEIPGEPSWRSTACGAFKERAVGVKYIKFILDGESADCDRDPFLMVSLGKEKVESPGSGEHKVYDTLCKAAMKLPSLHGADAQKSSHASCYDKSESWEFVWSSSWTDGFSYADLTARIAKGVQEKVEVQPEGAVIAEKVLESVSGVAKEQADHQAVQTAIDTAGGPVSRPVSCTMPPKGKSLTLKQRKVQMRHVSGAVTVTAYTSDHTCG
uniref:Uncharacterized protein n=1 Tax=Chromera velia CCMP2878 TaxID=1169474 RepID=A0A0G4GB96_9ALVE|eukprot:Cvel_21125.t1-p1 / transcript=Cvel_21125.t1 / gene=Cvel_21125 / organism=Chromera_velia_CCMP2878 / gene_product=hypothetical protein / transcript_product=hypothetical protein / location=Cvel_scaffold1956:23947-24672(+) / protein_length=242 / sequence_SO=supercontig / SO=protein_coding / is_pseudo=false